MNRRMFFGSMAAATGAVSVKPDVAPEPIRQGDVLVIEHPGILSQAEIENVLLTAERCLPGVRVLVLEEGMKACLLRPEGPEAVAASEKPAEPQNKYRSY
jgi:hypothetical protein